MLEFKKITKQDIPVLRPSLERFASVCDHTLGGIYLWSGWFDTHYCISDGILFLRARYTDGLPAFTFIGEDSVAAYLKLREYCDQSGERLRLYCITIDVFETLRQSYPSLVFTPERDMFDYIYDSADFRELTGKKWNGQRNHINRFKRTYPDHKVLKIETDEDIKRVREFFSFLKKTRLKDFAAAFEELERIDDAMNIFFELGLCGAYITVGESVVAASLGEIAGNTLFVHTEKALVEFSGVYPMMANSFARLFGGDVKYINREEDEGDEGLRRSKMSYHPVILKEKYFAR